YLSRVEPKDRPPDLGAIAVEQAIQEARDRLPPDRAAPVLARGYALTGRADRAEEQYLAALRAKPDDAGLLQDLALFSPRTGQGPKAESYLQKVLDPRTRASESQREWARRQLALGLAAQGGYRKVQEGLALIERNLQGRGGSDEDRRLKALLLGAQPGGRQE